MFILIGKKKCSKCGDWKDKSEFYKHPKTKDGLQPSCKACHAIVVERCSLKNLERKRETTRLWGARNKEKKSEYNKRWKAENRDSVTVHWQNRRAIKKSRGRITAKQWQALKEFYNYTCLCCERREPEVKLQLDHVVPFAQGGTNTVDNAQPLCPTCNQRKYTRIIDYRRGIIMRD